MALSLDAVDVDNVTPIRSELFSLDRLRAHAISLAKAQRVGRAAASETPLPERLRSNIRVLTANFIALAEQAKGGGSVTSAGEWFLDNFHVMEEQARQVQRDLPPSFYRELPKLNGGHLQGFPRVYAIAWALIAHSDSALDAERLEKFIEAYQSVTPLNIGELWAFSITLRLVLVENLRRLTDNVVKRIKDAERGKSLAIQALALPGDGAALLLKNEDFTPAKLVAFELSLRGEGLAGDRLLNLVEAQLADAHTSSQATIQEEYQAQSADDVSVRNDINAMRLISNLDWADFFEQVSLVDRELRNGTNFARLDFPTRDRYRRTVEGIARRSRYNERFVARRAVAMTRSPVTPSERTRDLGFYLIDAGRRRLERDVGYRATPMERILRTAAIAGLAGYAGAIVICTCCLVLALLALVLRLGASATLLPLLALIVVVPTSDLAIAVINRIVTRRWQPQTLPAFSLKGGIPPENDAILVVPTLLGDPESIRAQVERLEVHYLANADAGLRFVLLSDWNDSDTPQRDDDQARLDCAAALIQALNERYAAHHPPIFVLLHRERRWNEAQQTYMGWERKRGKLRELNRLLRGARDTSFVNQDQAAKLLGDRVRYVVTLDADTRLPRGAVRRLIGKMAHPLNRPQFDVKTGCVTAGHAVLQPRVTPSLPAGSESSLFQWAFSGPNGLDPYAFAVSDVYQDIFGQGSFVGKGIYDIDAFEAAMDSRIPENTVLSHDLLEGTVARAALVSDVEVVEEFPTRYDVEIARQHRWTRGDWQLLPWIFGRWSGGAPDMPRQHVPALGRWKMLDNLRRSLSAPALLLSFLVGWWLPWVAALVWTLFLGTVICLPSLLPIATGIVPRRRGYSMRGHARNLARDTLLAITQILFNLTFLARLAFLATDAISRTLFRMFISRRRLLEWVSFAQTAYSRRLGWKQTLLQLAGSICFVLFVAAVIGSHALRNVGLAAPFLALWSFSPILARFISQAPRTEPHLAMSSGDRHALRLAARRTWSYFDKFVTDEENALPPDNFQEDPVPVIAHRTSPTNIGVYLCSVLAARDFGWIGTTEAVERIEKTIATLKRLERYRGHFVNWYDTRTLRALDPRYVSTVDSGNLMGSLITIKNACRQMTTDPLKDAVAAGVQDTLAAIQADCGTLTGEARAQLLKHVNALLDKIDIRNVIDRARLQELRADAGNLKAAVPASAPSRLTAFADALCRSLDSHVRDAEANFSEDSWSARMTSLASDCSNMADAMEFGFLYDRDRHLLSIGYRLEDQALDANAYDLLASEARLASFCAIAKGDVSATHWFHLGRTLTPSGRIPALQSWAGSMFEYLMPVLLMHEPPGSLLSMSNHGATHAQIRYLASRGLPWGVSESQYNARDRDSNYQYSAFGVPELGIKRGLAENIVVAPYASGLAAMIMPAAARRNLDALTKVGALGDFGWYEAIDYTPARLPEGADHVVIRSFMAHHQGMTIVGLANVLNDGAIRELFHSDPMIQAAELLLQERMPRDVLVARLPPSLTTGAITFYETGPRPPRRFTNPSTAAPRTHLLSNANYSVMITVAGGGYSRWQGYAINRWREDATRDNWGSFIYLRDLRTGAYWSAAHQPVGVAAESYEALFCEDRATFKREDSSLVTTTEICVSPEDDSEVRRVTITNTGSRLREIEVTSFMELALARPADDAAHPAFSKLFVQTEYQRETGALIATRRKRDPSEKSIWAAHLSVVDGESVGDVQYETDRAKFLTRGRSAGDAAAVTEGWPLSNTAGAVLDPCFSLRRRIQLGRGQSVSVSFWTLVADTRATLLDMIDRHHDGAAFERASTLAATFARSQSQHLGISGDEQHLFQALAGAIVYMDARLRALPEVLAKTEPPAQALWPLGISGDLPIVLVRLFEDDDLELVRQLIRARDYWRAKGLASDLVLLNERPASYAQELQKALEMIMQSSERGPDDALGHIILARSDLIGENGTLALRAAARVELSGKRGKLEAQVAKILTDEAPQVTRRRSTGATSKPTTVSNDLQAANVSASLNYFNGYGGFSSDGREYVSVLRDGRPTPAPWINVVANAEFGFQVSAEGAGFCWSANSQQNQVTPWSNDPVTDESGDNIYIKDLESGELWSPAANPIARTGFLYVTRHGQGYSNFQCSGNGVSAEMQQFVPRKDGVKITRLTLKNTGNQARRLSLTHYAAWALGPSRAAAGGVQTWRDEETGALFARNPASADFATRVGFMAMPGRTTAWTCDRREFLGRNGAPALPRALEADRPLSGQLGCGLDPCGVLQTEIELSAGAQTEIVLLLGQARDADDAKTVIARYGNQLDAAFAEVSAFWDDTLGTLQIRTPDRTMDIMANRWLLYQTLSCRMWARAGFYQVSGAYGFRDQLQDSMAMCLSRPELARAQLLRAAGRQFVEGDVQHWWLPESGKGIRTHISDDKAWLAYVAAHYVDATGDEAVWEETLPFLSAPPIPAGQHDTFSQPDLADQTASLYEHCARALDASLALGAHQLPLMGTGDWNDGMNRVGEGGKGESVWLGWFLHATLQQFATIAEQRRDSDRAARWLLHMDCLREGLEQHGWDGAWYRRAFFDDGFALGSAVNRECRIDSIAQSWAVISGVAPRDRVARAMEALDKYLVRWDDRIMTLFTPPFVSSTHDPGYIKGYPAGIRENGGQYTHGVLWAIIAHAMRGDGDRAVELLAMLNPINHARTRSQAERYRVEPYVACGDVYSVAPLTGRGGWTWYSGSAAWMYRTATEYIVGIKPRGGRLMIDPCIPRGWPRFEAVLRHRNSVYEITVENPDQVNRGIAVLELDGQALPPDDGVPLVPDSGRHIVRAVLGNVAQKESS